MALSSAAIKDALVALFKDVQYKGEKAFVEVKGHPRGEFDGYPSLRILPGDQLTEKAAMGQNDRTVNFILRTHLKARDDGTEFDYMYSLTDLIIDTLDEADFDNTLDLSAAGIDTWILNATRADWFETDTQAGAVLMCDVAVSIQYSQDL